MLKLLVIAVWGLLGYIAVVMANSKKREVLGYLLGLVVLLVAPVMLLIV